MAEHHVDPDRAAFEAFKSLPRDTPIHMLNLVRFRDRADYPADHDNAEKPMSGDDAYREYGKRSGPIFARVGGLIVYRGKMEAMLIGPRDERWDAIFVAFYPNAAAFLEMVIDEDYRKAVVHRQAAVESSRLIRMAPMDLNGDGFG